MKGPVREKAGNMKTFVSETMAMTDIETATGTPSISAIGRGLRTKIGVGAIIVTETETGNENRKGKERGTSIGKGEKKAIRAETKQGESKGIGAGTTQIPITMRFGVMEGTKEIVTDGHHGGSSRASVVVR